MRLTVEFLRVPKPALAAIMVATGVVGRILLAPAANVEPVLVLSMLAGAILGGRYALVVPISIMSLSDLYFYFVPYGDIYPTLSILGLAGFVYSGYVLVAALGGFVTRRQLVWRTKTTAVFTAISIPLTVAFDVWTAFGDWLFIQKGMGTSLVQVYEAQGGFTLIHIWSSLLFAPILGTTFLAMHLHGVPVPGSAADAPAESPGEGSQ